MTDLKQTAVMGEATGGGTMTRRQSVFIGVGAMVGAGIFALLGEAGTIAQSAVWISFFLAGIVAALQGYSFAYLGKKHASDSGMMGYIAAGYGQTSRVTSVFSWMVWATITIVVAMVAVSFGSYAAAVLTGGDMPTTLVKICASLVVVGVTALNALGGSGTVAKAQSYIVRIVIIVLLGLSAVTMATADWSKLAPATYPSFGTIIGSVALTFFAFLGFGIISFTSKDLKNKNDLGPATYIALAVATLLYVAIALGVFGQLTPQQVADAGPTAIALAAKPVLGTAGYWIVGIVAILSTAGAANANIYATPGLLGALARDKILPPALGQKKGRIQLGLLLTCMVILLFVWALNLSAIASLGSAVALSIFLAISIGHIRIRKETGVRLSVLLLAIFTVVVTLLGFFANTAKSNPASLVAFGLLFVFALVADVVWRSVRNRQMAARGAEI
jgi:amino acid transporter